MFGVGIAAYLGLAGLCIVSAIATLSFFSLFDRTGCKHTRSANIVGADDVVRYLFDGESIVTATDPATRILDMTSPNAGAVWPTLERAFRLRFSNIPATAEAARNLAPIELPAQDANDPAKLVIRLCRDSLIVTLEDLTTPSIADIHIQRSFARLNNQIDASARLHPDPIWMQSASGEVQWSNNAYQRLIQTCGTGEGGAAVSGFDLPLTENTSTRTERVMVQNAETGRAQWFRVTKSRAGDRAMLNFALDINPVIEAEMAQRKFVQTLTKTFAQLSTGLAIFNRDRQLALFNPALIDLLILPAEFLSARPTLNTFFDRLRESRMMPDRKDYANWRQQIADLVIASVDGNYQETWSLPSGLTYRVTGRPHPDGAIALLFEDISAEISLTRRFRAQLNLGQSVIDTLDEAIAVFSSNGALRLSNAAFRSLWKLDSNNSFAEMSIRDALRQWKALAHPSPFWAELRGYMASNRDRSEWFSDVEMKSGAKLECRVAPLTGTATLLSFRLRPILEAQAQPAVEEPS